MKFKSIILLILTVFIAHSFTAQNKKDQIKISGKVTDFNSEAITNAIIYVDSVKTEVTTNRKGIYKIKVSSKIRHIGAFTDTHGLLSTTYTGEQKIDFVYRDSQDATSGDDMKLGVVYKRDKAKSNSSSLKGTNYSDYSSVTQLLNARFPFVRVSNGLIKIGNGLNSFGNDSTPLIIMDGRRTNVHAFFTLSPLDIEHIRVIRNGSEAAEYGSLGASNGVIVVKLKDRS